MRQRTLLIALATIAIVAAAGIAIVLQPDDAAAQRQQQGFTVSFAAAESALGEDRENQLRDWARIGLASHLDLDTQAMRDAFFDAFPIRDNGFADLARQPTGPGRALLDGDTLHLLIPRDDVNDKRTAGLLLDQHRTDAGDDPRSTNDFRTSNGYVSERIDNGLGTFLSKAKHLSTLEVRGDEVWAGGWNWPGPDVTAEDISLLQSADPLLGQNGAEEGAAMLRDVANALARQGETDGLLRAVQFGDAGAMIGKNEIFLSPPGHQWSTRVLEALAGDTTMRITDGRAIHVDRSPLHHVGTRKATLGEVLSSPGTTSYVNESFRATLATKDGPVVADALPQTMTVTVREVTAEKQQAVPGDVLVHRGAEWSRVDAPPRIGVSAGLDIAITLNSGAPGTAGPAARIVLICPEDDTANGCGD